MQRKSGTVVGIGIGSVNGIRGFAGHGANCPSKTALISYCECLRLELKGSGVNVVTLCPGYIDTPLTLRNQYSMLFLLRPQDCADQAFKVIESGASYRVIPWHIGCCGQAAAPVAQMGVRQNVFGPTQKAASDPYRTGVAFDIKYIAYYIFWICPSSLLDLECRSEKRLKQERRLDDLWSISSYCHHHCGHPREDHFRTGCESRRHCRHCHCGHRLLHSRRRNCVAGGPPWGGPH